MMNPQTISEVQEIVRSEKRVLPVGSRTKRALSEIDGPPLLSLTKLTGITQYEPSEYTFTALAGTTIASINEALREKGQYLPFDPMLSGAGATIGGTVASGLSGAGRFRYGGLRDFLLGLQFINGSGDLITAGAKVVKNAAGFDIPKFMIGSLGRFGVFAEMTFKVFPREQSSQTVEVICKSHEQAIERLVYASNARWELDALDYNPEKKTLSLRVNGPAEAVDKLAKEIATHWTGESSILSAADASAFWSRISEFEWVPQDAAVLKLPLTPKQYLDLQDKLTPIDGLSLHLSIGGACAWIAATKPALTELNTLLQTLKHTALVIRGRAPQLWYGHKRDQQIHAAVKRVFDPEGKFPDLTV